jgi:hypothetical protein
MNKNIKLAIFRLIVGTLISLVFAIVTHSFGNIYFWIDPDCYSNIFFVSKRDSNRLIKRINIWGRYNEISFKLR